MSNSLYLEVQLPHPAQQRLARLVVLYDMHARVLDLQPRERYLEVVRLLRTLSLNAAREHWLREVDPIHPVAGGLLVLNRRGLRRSDCKHQSAPHTYGHKAEHVHMACAGRDGMECC